MNKKFLSLVLALVMVLGTFGNVFAAAATDKKEANDVKDVPKLTSTDAKVQWLIDNSIVIGNADDKGNPTGDMDLKSPIRRDAVAKMLVYAIGEKDLADKLQGVYRPFPDVEVSNIMNGYISAAASRTSVNNVAIINGYEDGMFRPTNNVTYAELAKMLVVAIDKDLTQAKADSYKWYQDWINRAVQLGIFDGLSIDKPNDPAVRKDAFAMIYNAFYKLREIKAVPSNETRGIISERSLGDKLVLNQGDFKKEFKVDANTVFVNQANVGQKWLANRDDMNKYYVGSLVRVLTDKDGVVTHIIEMGNPVSGIQNRTTAWVDLGNKTLKTYQSVWGANNVTLSKDSIDITRLSTRVDKFEVTSKTAFYVADYDNNILTEVKDYAAAKALVADKANKTSNVYLAYEVLPQSGVKEAKVVVFNKAYVEANKRLVRVTKAVSSPDYLLNVQTPGETQTTVEQFSTRNVDSVWPYNYELDAYDVVKLVVNNNATTSKADRVPVIDSSEDNIYEVDKFLLVEGSKETEVNRAQANAVVLRDKEDYTQRYDLPTDYNKFFGVDFKKGAHVQIALRGGSSNTIDVVSVLPEGQKYELRGNLPNGVDTKLVKGVVYNIVPRSGSGELDVIQIVEKGNKRPTTFVTAVNLASITNGDYVEVEVGKVNKIYNYPEILSLKAYKTPSSVLVAKLGTITFDAKGAVDATSANKTALEDAKVIFGELKPADENADLKALVNLYIESYNKADTDASNDIAPIA